MSGGLMQLVAYGAQDVYLTGNPQITYFKNVHRRHTNFSMESIEQTFNGNAGFGKRISCTVSRNGDLIHKMYVEVDLPAISGDADKWMKKCGLHLLEKVDLEIGGQKIDSQTSEWMYVWNELTMSAGHSDGLDKMLGEESADRQKLFIPLQFWFCRHAGLCLPLIALQYHDVKVNIQLRSMESLVKGVAPSTTPEIGVSLWVDYIYLDTDERRRFAQSSHEYLIEQVQFTGASSVTGSITGHNHTERLNFNHPIKELIWVARESDVSGTGLDFTSGDDENPCLFGKLMLNGHERFKQRSGDYFSLVQPYQCHSRIPTNSGINAYSFALKPEDHQPSGTCNMSRIDNASLQLTIKSTAGVNPDLFVFGVNYNVLRIVSGMGGLAFSN